MATGPPSSRTEIRPPMKVLVELYSFENATYELTYTVDVSSHAARVLTKDPWQSNQHLAVRSVQGNLYSRARCLLPIPSRVAPLPSAWNCIKQQRIGHPPDSIHLSSVLSALCKTSSGRIWPASKNCSHCATDGITIGDAEPSYGPFITKRPS